MRRNKEKSKRRRRLWVVLLVLAAIVGGLCLYGYAARQDPVRMVEIRIVHLERVKRIDLPPTRFLGKEIVFTDEDEEKDWGDFIAALW
jgi:hypothetical protein